MVFVPAITVAVSGQIVARRRRSPLGRAKTALTCSSLTGSPVKVCRRAGTANKQVLGIEAQSEPVGEVGLELGELSRPILGRNGRV